MNIINIEHISKIFGGKVIFDDVSCGISEGEKIGVIGINGTGKTTLLRVLAGLEQQMKQVITQNGSGSHTCSRIRHFRKKKPYFPM